MTYLFFGASAFIVYLQIHEAILRKKDNKKQLPEGRFTFTQTLHDGRQSAGGNINQGLDLKEESHAEEPSAEAEETSVGAEETSAQAEETSAKADDSVMDYKINDPEIQISVIDSTGPSDDCKADDITVTFGNQFITPHAISNTNMQDTFGVRRRTSMLSSYMGSEASDDVYNYIVMHHGTATMTSGHTNYFLKGGTLSRLHY